MAITVSGMIVSNGWGRNSEPVLANSTFRLSNDHQALIFSHTGASGI